MLSDYQRKNYKLTNYVFTSLDSMVLSIVCLGFLSEHGPLLVNDDDTLRVNPYAWNMKANMIYLEAPVGVGFSKGSAADMKGINDDTTSSDNRDALKAFFVKFPQYLFNGLYVSGESYAGIYVPTLIAKVVDDATLGPFFMGAVIGNGLYSWEKNQQSVIFFAKYHGLIDTRNWAQLLENCCTGNINQILSLLPAQLDWVNRAIFSRINQRFKYETTRIGCAWQKQNLEKLVFIYVICS